MHCLRQEYEKKNINNMLTQSNDWCNTPITIKKKKLPQILISQTMLRIRQTYASIEKQIKHNVK